jgi:hypothetical protein
MKRIERVDEGAADNGQERKNEEAKYSSGREVKEPKEKKRKKRRNTSQEIISTKMKLKQR